MNASPPIECGASQDASTGHVATFLIALSVALGLAPIWLVQYDMWDGVAAAYAIESNDFSGLKAWLLDSNWWLLYAAYRAIAWCADFTGLPWLWFAKAVASAGVIGMAIEVRLFAKDVLKLDAPSAVFAAVLLPLLPFTYMLYDSVHLVIVFAWLALLGVRWVHHQGAGHNVMGWILIGASFQLNSNFAFVLGLELARWMCWDKPSGWHVRRSFSLLCFAVAVYLATRFLSAPSGLYAGYNNLLNPLVPGSLFRQLSAVAMFATWGVFPFGILLFASTIWLTTRRHQLAWSFKALMVSSGRPVVPALLVLLASASLPYIALGKGPALFFPAWAASKFAFSGVAAVRGDGWLTLAVDHWIGRHAFLWVIPVCLSCAALVGAMPKPWRNALMAGTLIQAIFWSGAGHWAKINRAANEQHIVQALKQMPAPPSGSMVDVLVVPNLPYLFSTLETNYLLVRSWSKARYLGVTYFRGGSTQSLVQTGRNHVIQAVAGSPAFAAANVTADLKWTSCTRQYQVNLPEATAWMQIHTLFDASTIAIVPASLETIGREC